MKDIYLQIFNDWIGKSKPFSFAHDAPKDAVRSKFYLIPLPSICLIIRDPGKS